MLNGIIVEGQVIEFPQECMNLIVQIARMNAGVSAPTPAPAPVESTPQPKVYEHVTEGFSEFRFVRKDNAVTVVGADGKFLYQKAPRAALNARLKAAGFVYDKDTKAWVLTTKGGKRDIKGAEAFVANNSHEVSADELNAILDGWTNKSARRANKATK